MEPLPVSHSTAVTCLASAGACILACHICQHGWCFPVPPCTQATADRHSQPPSLHLQQPAQLPFSALQAPAPAAAPPPGPLPPGAPVPQVVPARSEQQAERREVGAAVPADPARLQLTYTPERSLRPDYGKGGRRIMVRANWFKVSRGGMGPCMTAVDA